ncbi:MAG: IS21 family transposase, partial [Gemmatimonadota bacterium]
MGRRRVEAERLRELVRLRRLGASARRTARLLRMGPNTERWYRAVLGRAGLLDGPPDRIPSLEDVRAAVSAVVPASVPQRLSVE